MNTKGMTAIELLVVVVLIGFLLALLTPFHSYGGREKPRRVKCAGNLKQIGTALHTYAADNGNNFPVASGVVLGDASSSNYASAMESLAMLYPKYVADGRLYICPSADNAKPLEEDAVMMGMLEGLYSDYDIHVANFIAEFSSLHCDYGFDPTHTAAHKAGVAIAADRPNTNVRDNSPNHKQAGQNVLYVDGSVCWRSTTNCGYLNDEIYDVARPAGVTDDADNSNIK